jgi:hypothetical protein
LVAVYHALHRPHDSDAALERLEASKPPLMSLAGAYAYRGQHDRAIDLLEQAFARHEAGLWSLKTELLLRNIANEPRFKMLLRRMNLPE